MKRTLLGCAIGFLVVAGAAAEEDEPVAFGPENRIMMAQQHLAADNFEDALRHFTAVIDNPFVFPAIRGDALTGRARTLTRMGRHGDAIKDLDRASDVHFTPAIPGLKCHASLGLRQFDRAAYFGKLGVALGDQSEAPQCLEQVNGVRPTPARRPSR